MANTFIHLPVPLLAGPGPTVNTSALVASKSVVVEGGPRGGIVVIEGSHDGVHFAPVLTLDLVRDVQVAPIVGVFSHMRSVRRNGEGPVDVNVGAETTSENLFATLPFPTGGNFGIPLDSSALGITKTFIVSGEYDGALAILGSNDTISYDPAVNFSTANSDAKNFIGAYARLRVQRVASVRGPYPVVTVGASPAQTGGGGPGPQGAQGNQGNSGGQGPQGTAGTGTQGAQGDSGTQGAQGFQGGSGGAQGFQGFQGAQGFQGLRGTQGVIGFSSPGGTTKCLMEFSGTAFASSGGAVTKPVNDTGFVATGATTTDFAGYPLTPFQTIRELRVKPIANTLTVDCVVRLYMAGFPQTLLVTVPAGSTAIVTDLVNSFVVFPTEQVVNMVVEIPTDADLNSITIAASILCDGPTP